jgi:hypothetical protein
MESHSTVFARYERFVNLYVSIHKPIPDIGMFPLYKWQSDLYNKLKLDGSDREIHHVIFQLKPSNGEHDVGMLSYPVDFRMCECSKLANLTYSFKRSLAV